MPFVLPRNRMNQRDTTTEAPICSGLENITRPVPYAMYSTHGIVAPRTVTLASAQLSVSVATPRMRMLTVSTARAP